MEKHHHRELDNSADRGIALKHLPRLDTVLHVQIFVAFQSALNSVLFVLLTQLAEK